MAYLNKVTVAGEVSRAMQDLTDILMKSRIWQVACARAHFAGSLCKELLNEQIAFVFSLPPKFLYFLWCTQIQMCCRNTE